MSDFNVVDKVNLKKATIMFAIPDILITRYKFNVTIDEEDAKKIDETHMALSGGREVYVVVDLREGQTTISKEAEQFFTTKGRMVPHIKAVALIQATNPSIFSRFLEKFYNTVYSTKTFGSVDAALTWLDKQRLMED